MKHGFQRFGILILVILYGVYGLSAQNKNPSPQSLLLGLKAAQADTAIIQSYIKLYSYYDNKNLSDSAIHYLEKAAFESEKSKSKFKLGNIYNNLAIAYRENEEYDKSLNAYDKSINAYHKINDPGEYNTRINKAILLGVRAEYSKSLEQLMITLKYYESVNNQIGIGDSYKVIGRVFLMIQDNQKALEYYFKAKSIFEREKDFFSLSASLESLGSTYMNLKKYELAITYHQQQLDLAISQKFPNHEATALNNIGLCYFELGKYENAIKYYNKSLEIRKVLKSKEGIISCYQKLSRAYAALGDYPKALEYQKQASVLVESSSKNPQILTETYQNLYQLHEKNGNDKEAFKYYKSYVAIQDSLEGKKLVKEVEKIKAMYEAEKKQNEILVLSNKIKLQTAESEKQEQLNRLLASEKSVSDLNNQVLTKEKAVKTLEINAQKKAINAKNELLKIKDQALSQEQTIKWLLLGFMVMLLALVSFVYINYQKEKKIKLSIEKAKNQIEQKNLELDKLNKTKDKLFSIIAHDLKSPVSDLHYFIKPFFKKHEENQEALKISQKLADLNTTMDNLLVWALQQSRGLSLQLKTENIRDLIIGVANPFENQLQAKKITLLTDLPSFSAQIDERKLEIVVRNLISNAIKFTPEGGFVKISCRADQDHFEVLVKDTGAGMNSELLEKALQGLSSTDGTKGEKGTGLGLLICKEFVRLHKGQLNINSTPNTGTTVHITLPLSS